MPIEDLQVGQEYKFQLQHGPLWHGEEETEYLVGTLEGLDAFKVGIIKVRERGNGFRYFRPERVVSIRKTER